MIPDDFEERFAQGVDRFNQGEYFDCHEVWEDLWMEIGGALADGLKGMIQASVALHHAQLNNRRGALKLLESHLQYLERGGGELPIDLDAFHSSMARFRQAFEQESETDKPRIVRRPW